jgi:hypothetical protein
MLIKNAAKSCFLYLAFFFVVVPSVLLAEDDYNKADSIIMKVLENRDFYGKYIEEYDATAYIKGERYVKKKNVLYQYAPDFLNLDRRGENTFVESLARIRFKAPNYFTQQILAVNGSRISINDIRERAMQFLNVNIYNPSIFNNRVLIPGVKDIFKYYRFEYVSATDTLNHRIHQIRIIPKIPSQQLVSGFFYVTDSLWTIYQLDIEGKSDFSNYRIETEFGLPEKDFLLPVKTEITFHLKLLGNEVINHYFSTFQYTDVKKFNPNRRIKTNNYDLSNYFSVSVDTLPIIKDEAFWEKNRTIPLTPYEQSLVEASQKKKQQTSAQPADTHNWLHDSWNFFSQGAVSSKRFKYNDSQMSYSGLINPFKLAYTQLDGIMYWQEFRFRKATDAGREIQFNPSLAYLFQRQQVYFNIPIQWLFQPLKMGEIRFTLQNRNQSYNSTFIDMIEKAIPDSIHFNDLNLEYYHHYSSGIKGQYEIANGFLLSGGVNYDWYVPVKLKSEKDAEIENDIIENGDVTNLITDKYHLFLPSIGITWTPRPYYRINGKRKEYVGSNFPTLSAQCAWGIKDALGGNSDFTQLEADIQQKVSLGLMSAFQYYISGGIFLKTRSLYFADFNLFQKRNFPKSWDDPIGGIFQLLRPEWYNASRSYAQAHLIYEFPYMLSRLVRNMTRDILNERIYVSQLYTPILPCYTELGYGIGNYIGDAGVFVSFVKGRYDSVGAKFTFGLGK